MGALPLFFWFVSITWFVRIYLRAGRLWLAWTVSRPRTFYMLLTFVAGIISTTSPSLSLRHVQFLGESITVFSRRPQSVDGLRPVWQRC